MPNKNSGVVCRDLEGIDYEVATEQLSFRPSVYAVIIRNNRILLATQSDWQGYDFPGGGVELGETLEIALKREVKEETGLDIKVGNVIAVENSFFKLPVAGAFVQAILIYYSCEITGGEISADFFPADEKELAAKPEWIELEQIANVKFCNSVDSAKIIKAARAIA